MTIDEAAEWMLGELRRAKFLDQETAVYKLVRLEKGLTYYNAAGNLAIDSKVMAAFKSLLPDDIVWSLGQRHWRFRQKHDKPGRMQS